MEKTIEFSYAPLRFAGQSVYGREEYGNEQYSCQPTDQDCIEGTDSWVPGVPNTGFMGIPSGTLSLISGVILLVIVAVGVTSLVLARKRKANKNQRDI